MIGCSLVNQAHDDQPGIDIPICNGGHFRDGYLGIITTSQKIQGELRDSCYSVDFGVYANISPEFLFSFHEIHGFAKLDKQSLNR